MEPYKVWLRFTDGSEGVVDLAHLAGKGVFKAWDQPGFFAQAFVSAESATLTWPDGLDLCPDVLYSMVTGKPPVRSASPSRVNRSCVPIEHFRRPGVPPGTLLRYNRVFNNRVFNVARMKHVLVE